MGVTGRLSSRVSALPPSGTLAVGEQVRGTAGGRANRVQSFRRRPRPWPARRLGSAGHRQRRETTLGDAWGELTLRKSFANRFGAKAQRRPIRRPRNGGDDRRKQALYFSLLALLEPGDEVIVIDPCWVTYAPSIELAGGQAVRCRLASRTITSTRLRVAAAINARTRAIPDQHAAQSHGARVQRQGIVGAGRPGEGARPLADLRRELRSFRVRWPHTSQPRRIRRHPRTDDPALQLLQGLCAAELPDRHAGRPESICSLVPNCTQQLHFVGQFGRPQKVAYAALQQETDWAPFLRRTYQKSAMPASPC